MRIFRSKPREGKPGPPAISPESAAARPVHIGSDRRGAPREGFSVLRVVPQIIGSDAVARAETNAVSRAIAAHLRSDDRFCLFDDGSYMIVLAHTEDDHAGVVAQRLAVELTLRSAALRHRRWMVNIAAHPYDERTEAVLADLADADQSTA